VRTPRAFLEKGVYPSTPDKVRMVAAGLRKGGFRSASRYFGAANIEHLKAYGQRPGQLVVFTMAKYSRAVSRGVGPAACKESFIKIEDLVDAMDPPTPGDVASRQASDWRCGYSSGIRLDLALRGGLPWGLVDDPLY